MLKTIIGNGGDLLRGDEEITDSYAFKDSGSSWQLQNFQT